MKFKFLLNSILFFVLTLMISAGTPCFFNGDFENVNDERVTGFRGDYKLSKEAYSGRYCIEQVKSGVMHLDLPLVEVKPDKWYRMSVYHRNTVSRGEINFGILGSQETAKRVSRTEDWAWKVVPNNASEWRKYDLEFKTAPTTHGVCIFFKVENDSGGKVFWDCVSLEEFTRETPPLSIHPFPASVSFVDIPTKLWTTVATLEKRTGWLNAMGITVDLAKEKVEVGYAKAPAESLLNSTVMRGNHEVFKSADSVSGTGKVELSLNLPQLPAGKYMLKCELSNRAKVIAAQTKEIWRIKSTDISTGFLEPIKKMSVLPERLLAINGKPFHQISISHVPVDDQEYIKNMQQQFGLKTLVVQCFPKNVSQRSNEDLAEEFIKSYRAQLDDCQKNNFYGNALLIVPHVAPGVKINFDVIKRVVRGVKDHPALLAWVHDEPEIRAQTPQDMIALYQLTKQEDPDHFVCINLCQREKFEKFAPASDIASFDFYPYTGVSLLESWKYNEAILKAFPGKPFNSYLQTFNFPHVEMPAFDQVRAEFYMNIINGSRSLIAYSWTDPASWHSLITDPELQSYFKVISAQFKKLMPYMSAPGAKTLEGKFPEYVKYIYKELDGEGCIIIVNIHPTVAYDISFELPGSSVEDFFDPEWKVNGKNNQYSFKLAPYETMALKVKK